MREQKTELVPYEVQVDVPNLNIRIGPGKGHKAVGVTGVGTFMIVKERPGKGSDKGWGKLGNGKGWISLDYATRI